MKFADSISYNFFLFSKLQTISIYQTYETDLNLIIQSFEFHRMKCRKNVLHIHAISN